MTDVTHVLSKIEDGDPSAAGQLLPLVYDELRKLAAAKLANEKPGQTLQATALVHDAYIRLVDVEKAQHWDSRGHFFAAAAEAMRRIVIESARRKQREKHGGGLVRVDLLEMDFPIQAADDQILLLDEALKRFTELRPQAAELVKLRFFAGLTVDQAALVIGVSPRTARRLWVFAQAWLRREMELKPGCKH
jgi:RNA polymerase sigma factor (TIGR02999 family)